MRVCSFVMVSSVCLSVLAAQEETRRPAGGAATVTKAKEPAPQSTPALEGTRWWVEVMPDAAAMKAGEKAFVDVFAFADKKVALTACEAYGFRPSSYSVATESTTTKLATKQTSDTAGTSSWDAEILGDSIRGKLTWTKADGKVAQFTFAGKKSTILEGSSWDLRLQSQHADDEDSDDAEKPADSITATLRFSKGKLELKGSGLPSQPIGYTLAKAGESWRLDAVRASDGGDECSLRATVSGTTMRGTLRIIDSGGESTAYSLEGTQARAAKPRG